MIHILIRASVVIFSSALTGFVVYAVQMNNQIEREKEVREESGKIWETAYNNGWEAAAEHYKIR